MSSLLCFARTTTGFLLPSFLPRLQEVHNLLAQLENTLPRNFLNILNGPFLFLSPVRFSRHSHYELGQRFSFLLLSPFHLAKRLAPPLVAIHVDNGKVVVSSCEPQLFDINLQRHWFLPMREDLTA